MNCKFCGGNARIIEPDEFDQFDRIIFCEDCKVVFSLATKSTGDELINAYERKPEGKK